MTQGKDPQRIGSYRVLRRLGSGGQGLVFEAVHGVSGKRVALKTVRVAQREHLESLRREVQALRLLKHPGVVRVVDAGVDGGTPWYAMELLEGTSLRDVATRFREDGRSVPPGAAGPGASEPTMRTSDVTLRITAGPEEEAGSAGGPAPAPLRACPQLRETIAIVRRLCAPLSYLHGEGVVHRDLKPENVLVRPDGSPVLVDFGLVTLFAGERGRDSLTMAAEASGTLAYMSPEQARGDFVDARTDLYALGCILHELLTGVPPYVGRSPYEVLAKHATVPPPRPSQLAAGIPASLDDLVVRLLAKEPRDRLGYADVVAEELGELLPEAPDAAAPGRSYLYRPRLHGRDALLQRLQPILESAKAGRGALVVLQGGAGDGKTRLALEVGLRAQRLGFSCETGHGEESRGLPLHPLRPLLRAVADRCRELGTGETGRLLGRFARVLAACEPALLQAPGVAELPEPADLPPAAEAARRRTAMADLLVALSGEEPLLLVLDDLQWADDETVGLLEYLCRTGRLAETRLLLLATCARPSGFPLPPEAVVLSLGPLDAEEVREMASDMLARAELPVRFAGELHARAGGSPAAVVELLRSAVADGLLRRASGGRWEVEAGADLVAAPGSIREGLERRWARLSPAQRKLLSAAALLGVDIDVAILPGAAGLAEERVLQIVSGLLKGELLAEEAPGRLRFAQGALRAVVLAALPDARRREIHRLAADAIDALPERERAVRLLAVAAHREEAGETKAALLLFREAARAALARHALAEAEMALQAYLRLVPAPTAEEVEARLTLAADVLARRGRNDDARAEAERAWRSAQELFERDLQARSLRLVAYSEAQAGRLPEAEALVARARELAETGGRRPTQALVLHTSATIAHYQGDAARAEALGREALDRLGDDPVQEASILALVAAMNADQGKVADARSLYHESLARCAGRSPRQEAATLSSLSVLDSDQGRLAEARESLARALGLAQDCGDRAMEGGILSNLAGLLPADEAEKTYTQALAIAREVGEPRFEAHVLGCLAALLERRGDLDLAYRHAKVALEKLEQVGDRRRAAISRMIVGGVALSCGHLDEADSCLAEAYAALAEVPDVRYMGALRTMQSHIHRYRGDVAAGIAAVDEAIALLGHVGDKEELLKAYAERGHLELAAGRDASAWLRDAEAALGELQARPELQSVVASLRDAAEASRQGRSLLCGALPEHWPAALRGGLSSLSRPGDTGR